MSILICGMEIPTKQTTLTIFPNGYVAIYDAKDSFVGETRCVQVPPHGDLIDRNTLPWEKQGKMLTDPDEWGIEVRDIEAAPTIIPASEEGE